MYQRLLVPTDGSPLSEKAVDSALQLAKLSGASLVALSVIEPFPFAAVGDLQALPPQAFLDAQIDQARERVRAVQQRAAAVGIACDGLTSEAVHPWEAILQTAKDKACDAIVMASHGRRGVAAVLLGSETNKVLTHGSVPVLVVR